MAEGFSRPDSGLRPDSSPDSRAAVVLVIGAGPVGLALGIGLRLHGVDVLVVDRDQPGRHAPRAAVVWPREAEAMAQFGLGERLLAAALPLRAAHIHAGGERLGALEFGSLDSAFPRPLVIEQHAVERLLLDRYLELGGRIAWGVALEGWRADGEGIDARLSSGGVIRAGWLVGCDGARSTVRKGLGARFRGRPVRDLECVQINAIPRWGYDAPRGEGRFFLAPGAAVGCFPTVDGHWRFYCFKVDDRPDRRDPPDVAEMEALLARLTGAPVALDPAEPAWFNRARFQRRMSSTFRQGRVLLCGDSAHVWPAVGGHGMAAGLLGAHNLAWKLAAVAQGRAAPALLDTYAREQRASARGIMAHMRLDLLEAPQPAPVFAAMRRLLPTLLKARPLVARVEAMLGDMTLHHRASRLSRGGGPVRGGDRLPDGALAAGGRLHDRLDYVRWTLVGCAGAGLDAAAARAGVAAVGLGGADAALARRLGLRARRLLVRPDGYVALSAPVADVHAPRRWLAAWTTPDDLPHSRRQSAGEAPSTTGRIAGRCDPRHTRVMQDAHTPPPSAFQDVR